LPASPWEAFFSPGRPRAQSATRVFEIRRYTTNEGKLDALNARFRDQTMRLFEKHGMTNIGYWTPQDAPQSANTLISILAHPSREAATKNWDEFRPDPDWVKARSRRPRARSSARSIRSS
jgi:hypothetical protein